MLTDDRRTADAEVIGILLAHTRHFGSGELNMAGNGGSIPVCTEQMAVQSQYAPSKRRQVSAC